MSCRSERFATAGVAFAAVTTTTNAGTARARLIAASAVRAGLVTGEVA
jgi:hypothetical protein